MKTYSCIFLLSISTPFLLSAGLNFTESHVTHEATLDEKEYTGIFKFTNNGEKSVEILEVSASCGCTTALPSKKIIGPGESGEISATFDYGQREGKQVKSIRVETDQEEEKQIFLTLEVTIPTILEVSPSVTMWNRATESNFVQKEVIISSSVEDPIEIIEVVSSSDLFTYEIKVLEDGKKFSFAITPQNIPTDSKGIIRGTFVIKTNFSNPMKGTLKVYAIVR